MEAGGPDDSLSNRPPGPPSFINYQSVTCSAYGTDLLQREACMTGRHIQRYSLRTATWLPTANSNWQRSRPSKA